MVSKLLRRTFVKKFLLLLLILGISIGCRTNAQMPPASKHSVVLTWTAPSPVPGGWPGCGTTAPQSPCVYSVWRCTTSAAACGNTLNTAWSEITTIASRPSGTTYTDANPPIGNTWYAVETVQGLSNSDPSNIASVNVPGSPLAPALGAPNISELSPLVPMPQETLVASIVAPHLTATVR
jgi:hypothetical protein